MLVPFERYGRPFCWGVEAPTKNPKKEGLDRTSIFREGLLGKSGVTFFRGRGGGQGGCSLYKNYF